MSLDELIQAANDLDEIELERLLQQIVALRIQRKALPAEADDRLGRIHLGHIHLGHVHLGHVHQGVPADLRSAYQALRAKREAETLTEADHEQLIQLSHQIERLGAQRLDALALLAQLRQVALPTLMETLGVEIRAELTTQEAAELLNVSHSYLLKKIEVGDIPHYREGLDRWINFEDLMDYKQRIDAASSQSLDEMVALSEEMGLYV
jgi:excisionase family DNA binding protein